MSSIYQRTTVSTYIPEGRIGIPQMHLGDEPRLNPKILNAIKAVGLDKFSAEGITLTTSSAMEDLAEFIVAFESGAARCTGPSA